MRRDEMSVMFLGSPDGLMAEQLLHGANIGALAQQLDSEGIAETMRMGMDPGDLADTRDGAPQAFRAVLHIPVAAPEKVLGIPARRRQSAEGRHGRLVKQHLEPNSGFHGADYQMPGGLKSSSSQLGDVTDSETGVKQGEQQGPGPLSYGPLILFPHGPHPITGGKQFRDFLFGKRQRSDVLDLWRPDSLRRILGTPSLLDTPREKSPEELDLDSLRPRGERLTCGGLTGVQVRRERRGGNGADLALPERVLERLERSSVPAHSGWLEVQLRAALDERRDRVRHTSPGMELDTHIGAPVQGGNFRERALPIARAERTNKAPAVEQAIAPHRAVAERKVPAFCAMFAGFQVSTVRGEHSEPPLQYGGSLTPFGWSRAVNLCGITPDARAYDVFDRVLPIPGSRYYVVGYSLALAERTMTPVAGDFPWPVNDHSPELAHATAREFAQGADNFIVCFEWGWLRFSWHDVLRKSVARMSVKKMAIVFNTYVGFFWGGRRDSNFFLPKITRKLLSSHSPEVSCVARNQHFVTCVTSTFVVARLGVSA